MQPAPPTCQAWGPICWADAHPGAAGYLQAGGALLLLALVWYQASADHRRRLEERRAFVGLCEDAVQGAFEVIFPMLTWAEGLSAWLPAFDTLHFFYGSPANDTLKRVLNTPLPQWPSLSLYTRMRAIQHSIDRLSGSLDAVIAPGGNFRPAAKTTASAGAVGQAFSDFRATADEVARRGPVYRVAKSVRSSLMNRRIVREAVKIWKRQRWGERM